MEARQYTVSTHFSRRTELKDYLDAVFQKTVKIHRNLPQGGKHYILYYLSSILI